MSPEETNREALTLISSSILAGEPAYTLIGTYELPSSDLQKLMEVGTIIG